MRGSCLRTLLGGLFILAGIILIAGAAAYGTRLSLESYLAANPEYLSASDKLSVPMMLASLDLARSIPADRIVYMQNTNPTPTPGPSESVILTPETKTIGEIENSSTALPTTQEPTATQSSLGTTDLVPNTGTTVAALIPSPGGANPNTEISTSTPLEITPEELPTATEIPPIPTAIPPIPTAILEPIPTGPDPIVRISIPAIKAKRAVIDIGLIDGKNGSPEWNTDRLFDTNNRPDLVGHLEGSAYPGESSNIVLVGHNYTYTGNGIFVNLNDLQPGNTIKLTTENGKEYTYEVVKVKSIPYSTSGNGLDRHQRFLDPTPTEQLTLVTCGGANVGVFNRRVYVVAEPVE